MPTPDQEPGVLMWLLQTLGEGVVTAIVAIGVVYLVDRMRAWRDERQLQESVNATGHGHGIAGFSVTVTNPTGRAITVRDVSLWSGASRWHLSYLGPNDTAVSAVCSTGTKDDWPKVWARERYREAAGADEMQRLERGHVEIPPFCKGLWGEPREVVRDMATPTISFTRGTVEIQYHTILGADRVFAVEMSKSLLEAIANSVAAFAKTC